MKKTIIALATLALAASATAQTSTRLNAGKATEYGLVYSLPITTLDIYLEAELTQQHPGAVISASTMPLKATPCRQHSKALQ